MRMVLAVAVALAILADLPRAAQALPIDIAASRESTVHIRTARGTGSGFVLDSSHVVTCFHVVGWGVITASSVTWGGFDNIVVDLPSGESIPADIVSIPTHQDGSPLVFDFAVLKLRKKPSRAVRFANIAPNDKLRSVGDDVVFSGFPLAAPGMVTHRGMISGLADNGAWIFVQAPTNKGNSGGALMNSDGEVIGIISQREGQISDSLQEIVRKIDKDAERGSIRLMSLDPSAAIKDLTQVLDKHISTGIGYARNIGLLDAYLKRTPHILK